MFAKQAKLVSARRDEEEQLHLRPLSHVVTHTHADDDIILQGKYAVFNNVEENQTSFLTRAVVKL